MANFFKKYGSALAGAVTGGVMNQFAPTRGFSAAGSAAAGAITNKKNPLSGAVQGAAGGAVGAGIGGGITGMMNNTSGGVMQGFKNYAGSIPGFGGVGTANPSGALAKMFTPQTTQNQGVGGMSLSGNRMSYAQPGYTSNFKSPTNMPGMGFNVGTTAATGAPSSAFMPQGGGMKPMDMFKNMIPGAAVALGGSILSPGPENSPDYSGVQAAFQKRIEDAANPDATNFYRSTINAPTGVDATAANAIHQRNSDMQRAEAKRQLQMEFRANNGDTIGNSAYADAVAKNEAAYNLNDQARNQQTQFMYDQQQQQNKMAASQALQGLSSEQLSYYAGLAGLSTQQIQEQFQLDAGRAQSLQDIAKYAGQLMMESSVGANQVKAGG